MKIFNTPSVMIEEAKKAEHKHNPFLNLLISLVLILVSQLILIIPISIIGMISVIKSNSFSISISADNQTMSLISLFSTGF